MEERPLWRLLRKSMSIRQELRSYQERCWQLFLNCQCSSQSLSNFSKKKRRKNSCLSKDCRTLIKDLHQRMTVKLNGSASSATTKEESNSQTSVVKQNFWRPNSQQQVANLMFCQDQTLTCHQIYQSQDLMDSLLHSNQANQELRCAILSSL